MKTIFAVFLLLPMTTGFNSYVCSGPNGEERYEHKLFCGDGLKINIVSAHYRFTYPSNGCHGLCYLYSTLCDCLLDFNITVKSDLTASCNGLQKCNFRAPKPHVKRCDGETMDDKSDDQYTYSYIRYVCLPEIRSFVCSEPTDAESSQHNLSCRDADQRIRIISAYYGFRYRRQGCGSDCVYYNKLCDCHLKFDATAASNLMDHCNGMQRCNFQTPKPYIQSCNRTVTRWYITYNRSFDYYKYSYILYDCLTVTTTLPTTREQVTRQVYTDRRTIQSTEQHNSKHVQSTESMHLNQDTAVNTIVGSVVGCILLVILVIIVAVVILKRKTMRTFIGSHFKGGSRVSNPVYEAPTDGYNNVAFKNDNSPSVNVVKPDDYNHLHDIKNDNSMTTGNTYNHLGPMMGDYNHLPANNNSIHVDEHSDGAYNHLGMENNEAHSSEERHHANYNNIGCSTVDKPDADYNHLHGDKNEIPKTDYNHLGEIKKTETPNHYNHIGNINNQKVDDNYHHLGNVNKPVVNDDDYNHIGDTKHGAIVESELAHSGDLSVQEEQTQDDCQYEITDDERGDYSNISKQQSNYENVPISDLKTRG